MSNLAPLSPEYDASLLEVHWAAQLPGAASALLVPAADWSHTNLLVEDDALVGRPLPDGRRASLSLGDLTLRVGQETLPLDGKTLADGLAWLGGILGAELSLLPHDLPERPRDKPFTLHGAEAQVHAWFSLAQRVLQGDAVSGGGEVRVWPHHFDIATLIELDPDADDAETARSVNVGLSPGDGSYAEPYWYVTPWPTPAGGLPPLARGGWHEQGFTAAVFPASQHDAGQEEREATEFVHSAVDACRTLLA